MQQPSPSSGCGGPAAAADDDLFDIVLPPDFLFPGADDDRYTESLFADESGVDQRSAEVQAQGGEERLAMSYCGQMYVFDSVPPQKVEAILLLLNGQETAPQSVKPQLTYLVQPIVVPQNYDRLAALTRYREKRKKLRFIEKADYSARREVASRIKRRRGRFVSSAGGSAHSQREAAEITFCTKCGVGSDATPMMRRGPNGPRTLCNACGLMWVKTNKIRKPIKPICGR